MTLLAMENEASEITGAKPVKDLEVNSLPDCYQCGMSYVKLIQLGIDFIINNLDRDVESHRKVEALKYTGVPVTITPEGDHWKGFIPSNIDDLAARLEQSGATLVPREIGFARDLAATIKELLKEGAPRIAVRDGDVIVLSLTTEVGVEELVA